MKRYIKFLLFVFVFSICSVSAKSEMNYVNSNGVKLSEKEFKFVKEFYDDYFFETMTIEDLNWISDLNIDVNNVEILNLEDEVIDGEHLYSTSHSTSSKKLSIAKSCSTTCTIITNLMWLKNPIIKSYDVIGARFENTNFVNNSEVITKLTSSKGTIYSTNNKEMKNGFGTSIKLPNGATNIIIQQKFYITSGGIVFASYQHSQSIISLDTSLTFSISSSGSGGVFNFYGSASGKFDNMGGVSINL